MNLWGVFYSLNICGRSRKESQAAGAESDPLENYICPICLEILTTPIRTNNCQHVFCKICFQVAVETMGLRCPLCRGPVSKETHKATDFLERMKQKKVICKACGKQTLLSNMRPHYKNCRKYIEMFSSDQLTEKGDSCPDSAH